LISFRGGDDGKKSREIKSESRRTGLDPVGGFCCFGGGMALVMEFQELWAKTERD